MRRVNHRLRHRGRRLLWSGLALVVFAAAGPAASAQGSPVCADGRLIDCRLPDWASSPVADLPSLFGDVTGLVWIDDPAGDAPADVPDILGVGIGTVRIDAPKAIRDADGLLKLGKAKKAVRPGTNTVVRIVLDRPIDELGAEHAGVHVATDVDGSRSDNVPAGMASPNFPFAGSQDVYSVTWASTTGKTRLLASDLSRQWYKSKAPFAASWASPTVLDVLLRPTAVGAGIRAISYAAGPEDGYDVASLGPSAIPVDGEVSLLPSCLEVSILTEPFVVGRMNEGRQQVRQVETPSSWRGGVQLPVDPATRSLIADFIASADVEGDGRVSIPTWVNLFEDGTVLRQKPDLQLALQDDQALVSIELGLSRLGFDVLRAIDPDSTGDDAVDAWLREATDTLRVTMPPFRSNKTGGLLLGEAVGACIPWFATPAEAGGASPTPSEATIEPAETSP